MIAYFCHPDDNDMLLSNRQRAYHCLSGWYFFAFGFFDFFGFWFFALMFRSLPPEIYFVLYKQ